MRDSYFIHLIRSANPHGGGSQRILHRIVSNTTSKQRILCTIKNTPEVKDQYVHPWLLVFKLIGLIVTRKVRGVVLHDRAFLPLTLLFSVAGIKSIFVCHSMFRNFLFLFKWLPLDKVVCVSNSVSQALLDAGVKKDKVIVIENGFCPPAYSLAEDSFRNNILKRKPPESLGTYSIAFVGRAKKEKGIYELMEAYKRMYAQSNGRVHMSIIGQVDHEFKGFLEQWDKQNFPKVNMIGVMDEPFERLREIGVDGVVIPSHREGFGLVLVEAIAAGFDVYASDIPPFRELAGEDRVAYFEPQNPGAIERAVLEKMSNPLNANQKYRHSQEIIEKYSNQAMYQKYNLLFQEVERGLI